jgi:hypothetical protein
MKAKTDTHNRYQWLFVSLSTLTLGLCAQWLLLFGGMPWQS